MIRMKIYERFINHYSKLWQKAIDNMNKHMSDYTTAEFRKWANLNTKYGKKTLFWMNKKAQLIKDLGLA